jgi:mycothiol synthase
VPDAQIDQLSQLTSEQAAEVLGLIDRVSALEGVRPVSEHVVLDIRYGQDPNTRHLLLRSAGELVGYAHLDVADVIAELAALDSTNTQTLVDYLIAEAAPGLRVWSRGKAAGSADVLRAAGLREVRVLLQLRRALLDPPLGEPVWPPGVTLRTFVVGADEVAWLEVNNLAFADHPDQSGWTIEDVRQRESEPWFDAAGFFLAERDGQLVGFHWTRVHDNKGAEDGPIGEVYVVGVAPSMQGQHLGGSLTLAGLIYLRQQGLREVMLYVDESNATAVRVYERLGFAYWDQDVCFQRSE